MVKVIVGENFYMFSVFFPEIREYGNKGTSLYFENIAKVLDLPTVEFLERDVVLTQELIDKYSTGLEKINEKKFEGVVIKHKNGSFKVINKHYDSKK